MVVRYTTWRDHERIKSKHILFHVLAHLKKEYKLQNPVDFSCTDFTLFTKRLIISISKGGMTEDVSAAFRHFVLCNHGDES